MPTRPRGLLGRLFGRLTTTVDEIEAAELLDTGSSLGCTPIEDLVPRAPASVFGEVRSVALRPQVQVPALVVELFDGTGPLQLVWLGRRAIAGIEPGVLVRAHGRVTFRRGHPTIFNPAYEIVPARG